MRKLLTLVTSLVLAGPLQAAISHDQQGHPPPGFTGIAFTPVTQNDRGRASRARREADAREAPHTHATDILVVHLSGGEIEDTANGKTVVNRWKPGDVELEAKGSSHSARNVGKPIDVV